MRKLALIALAALLPAVAGPAAAFSRHRREDTPAPRPASAEKVFPTNTTWLLVALDGKLVAVADPPSFSIDSALRGRGFSGCNTFSMALYPVKDQKLAGGSVAVTRTTCAPDLMALERTVLVTLHSLPKWELTADGDLTLTAGRTSLRFRRGV